MWSVLVKDCTAVIGNLLETQLDLRGANLPEANAQGQQTLEFECSANAMLRPEAIVKLIRAILTN